MEEYFIYIIAGFIFLCLLLLLIEHIRLNRIIKKYRLLIKGLSEKNAEDLMVSYSEELDKVKKEIVGSIETRISDLESRIPTCLRNIGMITYNAFDNIGNNMSFSIAAIDDKKNGLVLTGIYTRENSYVYAKEILNGKSKKDLSNEEREALNKAISFME